MKKKITTLLAIFSVSIVLNAQIPDRPVPPRLVNDFAGVLNKNEYSKLENTLEDFARQTSTQIVVVTVADLDGYDRSDYAFQLGEKWGVGQKGKDNGIVVLLKPKSGNSSGQVFIATGYGLEGVLPDAIVNREVVDNEMIPRFKQNDYYGGLAAGLNVIMSITRGEYTAEQYKEKRCWRCCRDSFCIYFVHTDVRSVRSPSQRTFLLSGKKPAFLAGYGNDVRKQPVIRFLW